MDYIHTKHCTDYTSLSNFLKKIKPNQLKQVIKEKSGYTVIWCSYNKYEYDL